jgi:hypothetical protein
MSYAPALAPTLEDEKSRGLILQGFRMRFLYSYAPALAPTLEDEKSR